MCNHTSRSLAPVEQRYSQIEGESLAIEYGVLSNRMYLLGIKFTVVTDHKPLVSLYTKQRTRTKPGPMRVDRHRLRLLAYDFDVIHEPGHLNPTDYASRHPIPIGRYTQQAQADLAISDDVEMFVNAIMAEALPDAVTWQDIAKATDEDQTMKKLKTAI